jgi:hypothetical protein
MEASLLPHGFRFSSTDTDVEAISLSGALCLFSWSPRAHRLAVDVVLRGLRQLLPPLSTPTYGTRCGWLHALTCMQCILT